jgi:two-component system, NarL family, sensor histidine kinase UhpB
MIRNWAQNTVMRILFHRLSAWSFIAVVFAVLAAALAIVGYFVFDYQRNSITRNVEQRLSTIAELRAQQIASWVSERRANAKVQGRRSLLANEIAQWLKGGAVEGKTASAIKSQFALIADSYGYRRVTLVDARGRPLLSTQEPPEISEVEFRAAAQAIRAGNTVISDFHLSVNKGTRESEIDILAPVYANENESSPIAALIFDIDPETSLHPLIETWPSPSASAEMLLVERYENRVRYLTNLRHQKNAQFSLLLPLDQPDLVEAMGLRGHQGVVAGVDYRGVNVVAVLRPIPDSPWVMVAKVDTEEVFAPIRKLGALTALATAIFIFVAAFTTNAWMRAKRESEEKFLNFSEAADQVFWILDLFPERFAYVNPAFERLWGYSIEDLYRNPGLWKDTLHCEDRPHVAATVGNWIRGMHGARYDAEYRIVRPDGEVRWIADHRFILRRKGGITSRIAGIAEDITEKKRLDEALRQANAGLEERVQSRTAELERSHQLLQALTAVQESIQEEERKRIARELHDELAQKLTVLKLQTTSVMATLPAGDPGLTRQMQDMNSLLTETMRAVGQIAADLRPIVLDELGLVAALRDLVEQFSERTKIECEFNVYPADLSVDNRLAMALYRMVQESLTNVARHAEATEVIVSLDRDPSGKITLNISDDGKGLPNEDQRTRGSFGLIGMRERTAMLGGEIRIHSQPGAGTSIEIVIP